MFIIKGKPLPPKRAGCSSKYLATDQMEVGDCVIVKNFRIATALGSRFKIRNKKSASRRLPSGDVGVWRTE